MNKKLLIYILALISLSGLVSAAFNINAILNPFNGDMIATFYLQYYAFIDALIYLILFLSLSQVAFLKIYSKSNVYGTGSNRKESKMIALAVSLALTVSMVILEMNTGFYLGQLYPIALVIFMLVLAILLYNLMLGLFTGDKGKNISAALTYLIIYGLLIVPFGSLYTWIETNAPLLSSILVLGALAAFIFLIIEMIGLFTGGGSSGAAGKDGASGKDGESGKDGIPGNDGKDGISTKDVLPSTSDTTEPPKQKIRTPGTNDALMENINNYSNNLQAAHNKALQFVEAAKIVGNQAFLYDTGAAPYPPLAAHWNNLRQTEAELLRIMQQINNLLNVILNDPLVNELSQENLASVIKLITFHTYLSNGIIDYYAKFVNSINASPVMLPPDRLFRDEN